MKLAGFLQSAVSSTGYPRWWDHPSCGSPYRMGKYQPRYVAHRLLAKAEAAVRRRDARAVMGSALAALMVGGVLGLKAVHGAMVLLAFGFVCCSSLIPFVGLAGLTTVAATLNTKALLAYRMTIAGNSLPINVVEMVAVMCAPAVAACLARTRGQWSRRTAEMDVKLVVLAMVFLLGTACGAIRGNPWYDIAWGLRHMVLIFFAYWFTRISLGRIKELRCLVTLLVIGATLDAVQGYASLAERLSAHSTGLPRENWVTSGFYSIGFVIAMALRLHGVNVLGNRLTALAVICVCGGWFVASFRRAGMLLLPILFAILGGAVLSRATARVKSFMRAGALLVPGVTILCFLFVPEVATERWLETLYGALSSLWREQVDVSVSARLSSLRALLTWFEDHPWLVLTGGGLGTTYEYFAEGYYGPMRSPGMGVYGYYLLNLGVIGLGTLVWIQIRFLRFTSRLWAEADNPYGQGLALALLVYGVYVMATMVPSGNFLMPQLSVLYGVFLALPCTVRSLCPLGPRTGVARE